MTLPPDSARDDAAGTRLPQLSASETLPLPPPCVGQSDDVWRQYTLVWTPTLRKDS